MLVPACRATKEEAVLNVDGVQAAWPAAPPEAAKGAIRKEGAAKLRCERSGSSRAEAACCGVEV